MWWHKVYSSSIVPSKFVRAPVDKPKFSMCGTGVDGRIQPTCDMSQLTFQYIMDGRVEILDRCRNNSYKYQIMSYIVSSSKKRVVPVLVPVKGRAYETRHKIQVPLRFTMHGPAPKPKRRIRSSCRTELCLYCIMFTDLFFLFLRTCSTFPTK